MTVTVHSLGRHGSLLVIGILLGLTQVSAQTAVHDESGFGAACTSACASKGSLPQQLTGVSGAKVVQGHAAPQGSYPWLVAIARTLGNGTFYHACSGTLIATHLVLTAAHCEIHPNDFVVANVHILSQRKSGDEHPIRGVIHFDEPYSSETYDNDVKLLYLADALPVSWKMEINPDPQLENNQGTDLSVAGWGSESTLGPPSDTLLETTLSTVDLTGCLSEYAHKAKHVIEKSMFCALGADTYNRQDPQNNSQPVADTCWGDSGGSVIRRVQGGYLLVGVVGWGLRCGDRNFAGVYTRGSRIADWVQRCKQDSRKCKYEAI